MSANDMQAKTPMEPCYTYAKERLRNPRTLKMRIRRLIYLSNFINLLVFGCVMLGLVFMIFKPVTEIFSNYIGTSIANGINSESFLQTQKLARLEDFKTGTPEADAWSRELDEMTKIDYFLPFAKWNVTAGKPDGPGGDLTLTAGDTGAGITSPKDDMVYVTIRLNDAVVFQNGGAQTMNESGLLKTVRAFYDTDTTKPLLNAAGQTVGTVNVGIAPYVLLLIIGVSAGFFLLMLFVMLGLSLLLSKLFTIPILTPLTHLNGSIRAIASGNYDELSGNRLELRRPLREIEELADSTNLIMQKMNSYAGQLEDQKDELEAQNEELEAQNTELQESKRLIQAAQMEIGRKEASLRNLMNNAGQGFLTFGAGMTVDPVYSLECASLLGGELEGASFPVLLADGDEEQRIFLENILTKILQERDAGKRAVYMPLLTDEISCGGRFIQVEYKIIPDPAAGGAEMFMAILTDITEKRFLQSQMETERNTLKMVVKIVVNYADFAASVRDFRRFMDLDAEQLAYRDEPFKDKLTVLFRQFHTYKGTFAQWGLALLPERLHEAESLLTRLGKEADGIEPAELLRRLRGLGLLAALEDELSMLKRMVGDDFMSDRDMLLIDKSRVLEIEKKMLGTLSPLDCKLLLPELRKLRYKPFKDLLRTYPEYVAGLADRMEKYIHPFEVTGDDFLADADKYGDLGRSLVHLFRNAVDHGIEPAEERSAAGKEEYANMLCRIGKQGDQIHLYIADDGRGIDLAALRKRAAAAGILTEAEASALTDDEAMRLIFRDELSTREQVTELSGRGIGLSSVRSEVEALGGTVAVASAPGRGTVFHIALPSEELSELPQLGMPAVMEPLIAQAEQFLTEQLGVPVQADGEARRLHGKADKLTLRKVTTFISVKGAVEGMFVVTVDDALSHALLRRMVIGGLAPEEEEDYVEDSLAEAANIILGNSLKRFQSFEEFILMDPPFTIHTEGASIKYADSDIWTSGLSCAEGEATVGFVMLKTSKLQQASPLAS